MKRICLTLGLLLALWPSSVGAQVTFTIPAAITCSDGFAIVFASGLPTCAATSGVGTVTNTTFTTGKYPKASGGAALVDGLMSESGSVVTTTGKHNATTGFQINGTDQQNVASGQSPTFVGANFSAIPETAITDGSLLARLAANETVTGAWIFSNASAARFDLGGVLIRGGASAHGNLRICADQCAGGVDITDVRTLDGGGFRVVVNNGATVGLDVSVSGIYSDTTASAANVFVTSGGLLQRSTSSARYKDDIRPFGGGLADLLRLQPKSFVAKSDPAGPRHVGFLAEDFDAAGLYNLVNYDEQGRPDAIQYDRLTTYIVNAFKELTDDVDTLKKAAKLSTSRTVSAPDTASRDKAIAHEQAAKAKRDKEAADAVKNKGGKQ